MPAQTLDLFARSLVFAEDVLDGIADDQRDGDTPCADMTVDRLAAHLIGGLSWLGALPEGGPADPASVPDPDLAGRPLATVFRTVTDLTRRTWVPERLDDTFTVPFGKVKGAGLVAYMVVEVLGHGWDLAVATNQRARPAEDLAEAALAIAGELGEDTLRAPGMMAPRVAVPAGAPAIDRLVAFLGRDPAVARIA